MKQPLMSCSVAIMAWQFQSWLKSIFEERQARTMFHRLRGGLQSLKVFLFFFGFCESIRCDKLYKSWYFYVMGYERTEVCHPKLWWTDRCLHPKMIITAGNSWIAHRKGYFASIMWDAWVKVGEEGMPRDPSYVCSSSHVCASSYESFFCNSWINKCHLKTFKLFFFLLSPVGNLIFLHFPVLVLMWISLSLASKTGTIGIYQMPGEG